MGGVIFAICIFWKYLNLFFFRKFLVLEKYCSFSANFLRTLLIKFCPAFVSSHFFLKMQFLRYTGCQFYPSFNYYFICQRKRDNSSVARLNNFKFGAHYLWFIDKLESGRITRMDFCSLLRVFFVVKGYILFSKKKWIRLVCVRVQRIGIWVFGLVQVKTNRLN